MLTTEEEAEIEANVAQYPDRRAAVVDALKIVQRHRGFVSDGSVKDIAAFLAMTPDEVDGVATFYNLIFRHPVGRHVVLLCDSVSCWIMGCDRLRERLEARLGVRPGETTKDGRFTLLPIVCLGACERAPAMMIGDEVHGDLDPQRIDAILERYP
jgi:NADH-quinone oxidoreductase subunit E